MRNLCRAQHGNRVPHPCAFCALRGGIPLLPALLESAGYTQQRAKIFDFKEVIGKISWTNDLAVGMPVPARLFPARDLYLEEKFIRYYLALE
jgi:hypothetical protein